MKDLRKLKVWERVHALTLAVYRETGAFPRQELYGITSQMRRASASVAANIEEGYGRGGDGEFHDFLNNAAGFRGRIGIFSVASQGFRNARCRRLQQPAEGDSRGTADAVGSASSSRKYKPAC